VLDLYLFYLFNYDRLRIDKVLEDVCLSDNNNKNKKSNDIGQPSGKHYDNPYDRT